MYLGVLHVFGKGKVGSFFEIFFSLVLSPRWVVRDVDYDVWRIIFCSLRKK